MNRLREARREIQKKNNRVWVNARGVDWSKYEWRVKLKWLKKYPDEKIDVINNNVTNVDKISIKKITEKMLLE